MNDGFQVVGISRMALKTGTLIHFSLVVFFKLNFFSSLKSSN